MSNISKDFVTKNGIVVRGTNFVTGLTSQTNSLQVDGGAAIAKNIIVGSTATLHGQTRITNGQNAFNTTTGALIVDGGLAVNKDLFVGGTLYAVITGVSSSATNVAGGQAGEIVYQISEGQTGFVSTGTAGEILVSNGFNSPQYVSTTTIYVDSAVDAENLYGGSAGSLVYQTGTDFTEFLSIGSSNSVLVSDGSLPSWTTSPTIGGNVIILGNLTVQGTATIVDSTVTNVVDPIFTIGGGPGGSAPPIGDQKDRGIAFIWTGTQAGLDTSRTGFFGFDHSTGFFTFITSATLANEIVSPDGGTARGAIDANLAGGQQGGIPIQSAQNVTSFIAPGTVNNYVLTWDNVNFTATWQSVAGTIVDNASTATHLAGGVTGSIPYQTEPGRTNFIGTGTQGNLLRMGTESTATFVSSASVYVGYSSYSNNILGGDLNYIPYQSSTSTTVFSNSFTFNGTVLSAPEIYISATTSATSTLTGALQVAGGVGIQGDLYVGGRIFLGGVGLDTISGTTGTFLDIVSTGTIFGNDITAAAITATSYLHASATANNVASYGRSLSRTREAFSVNGAIHTLGNVAVGGVLYAGMNDEGHVTGQNPHNKTINGLFVANNMLAGGTYDSITTTSTQTIDSFSTATYTSAKYMVQVTDAGRVHSQEIMLIHNGTNVYMTQYGIITTNGQLGTFSSIITSSNVLLYFTPSTATNMTVNVVRHSIIPGLQSYG